MSTIIVRNGRPVQLSAAEQASLAAKVERHSGRQLEAARADMRGRIAEAATSRILAIAPLLAGAVGRPQAMKRAFETEWDSDATHTDQELAVKAIYDYGAGRCQWTEGASARDLDAYDPAGDVGWP